jgi:hypothetical protein
LCLRDQVSLENYDPKHILCQLDRLQELLTSAETYLSGNQQSLLDPCTAFEEF